MTVPQSDRNERPERAPYRAPALTVHGTVAELTQRNLFGPGRQDGPYWWRRTG